MMLPTHFRLKEKKYRSIGFLNKFELKSKRILEYTLNQKILVKQQDRKMAENSSTMPKQQN